MIHGFRPADFPRCRIAEQHGVAVSQGRLAAVSFDEAEPIQIHVKAEIVVAVAAVPVRVLVANALHGPGQQAEVGKFADRKIDIAGAVRNWVERYPGQTALVERPHGASLRAYLQSVRGSRAHAISLVAFLGSNVSTRAQSRPVLEAFPPRPSPTGR